MDKGGQKVKRKNIYMMNTEQQQRKEKVSNRSNIQLKKHSNRTGNISRIKQQ